MIWLYHEFSIFIFLFFSFLFFPILNTTFIILISYNYYYFFYYCTNRVMWSFITPSSHNSWYYHFFLRPACDLDYALPFTFLLWLICYHTLYLSFYIFLFYLFLCIWSDWWSQSVWEPSDSILIVLYFLIHFPSNSITDSESFIVTLHYWYLRGITQLLTEDRAQTTYYT